VDRRTPLPAGRADNRFVTGEVIFADGDAEAAAVGERHWL
jgi:hypothetical protein